MTAPTSKKFHPQPLHLQVDDLEAGVGDTGAHNLRVLIGPTLCSRGPRKCSRRSHSVAGQTCWAKPTPPARRTRAISIHHRVLRVAAGHQVKRRIGKGSGGLSPVLTVTAQRMQPP